MNDVHGPPNNNASAVVASGFLHFFFFTDITLRKYLYILTFHTPQVQRSMTSQVEGGSELAALQQAAELEASEQKRVAEKAMDR